MVADVQNSAMFFGSVTLLFRDGNSRVASKSLINCRTLSSSPGLTNASPSLALPESCGAVRCKYGSQLAQLQGADLKTAGCLHGDL